MSRAGRSGVLVALALAAVGLFIAFSGGDDDGSDSGAETTASGDGTLPTIAEPAFEVIEMKGGEPVGGVRKLTYTQGERVRIEIRLDEPQEDVHIHGYEEEKLNPSGTVRFDFPARLDGIYELEAHGPDGDVVLAELVVNPS